MKGEQGKEEGGGLTDYSCATWLKTRERRAREGWKLISSNFAILAGNPPLAQQ